MNNEKRTTPKVKQPLQPYNAEREARLEQSSLEMFRKILGNPDLSVQEMREMNNRKRESTTRVIFLKKM